MNLAVRDVRRNVGRFALTALGIGLLLMIVMGMGGIYRGLVEDATLLVDRIGADLWIVQRATRGPFAEISRVPPNLVHRVRAVPGVAEAREFVYHTVQREHEGRPLRMAVLGLGWPADPGDWIPLASGRTLQQGHFELIADRSLGLSPGERLRLGKEVYHVVGVAAGMLSSGGDGIAFCTTADSRSIQFDLAAEALRLERATRQVRGEQEELGRLQPAILEQAGRPAAELPAVARPVLSAVLVRVAPGANIEAVREVFSGWRDVTAHTQDDQRGFLLQGTVDKARRQLLMFRVLLTIIAAIIMALILYTLTLDKLHAIALLKLIGAPNRIILGMILQQALLLGMLGYGVAYVVGIRLFPLFPRRVILANSDLLQLGIIVVVISITSSLLGIWRALQVAPNEALN